MRMFSCLALALDQMQYSTINVQSLIPADFLPPNDFSSTPSIMRAWSHRPQWNAELAPLASLKWDAAMPVIFLFSLPVLGGEAYCTDGSCFEKPQFDAI